MRMSTRRRWNTPGPGSYNIDVRPVTPTPPAYTIGSKSSEFGITSDWLPGPGSYASSGRRRQGPSYTIAGKHHQALERVDVPGPGSYNVDHVSLNRHREPAYSISGRSQNYHREISPGPGAYTVPSADSGPSFSMPGRKPAPELPETPGPGAYSAMERPRTPCISIGGRESRNQCEQSPGPGAYNPLRSPRSGPAYTISRRKPTRPPEESPGPGQYNAEAGDAHTHPRDPAISIANKCRSSHIEIGPGPGAYDPQKSVQAAACSSPSFTIPERRSRCTTQEVTPGPGAYFFDSTNTNSSSAHGVRIAGRHPRSSSDTSPGPGAYSPRCEWDGPAPSISKKISTSLVHEGPGPGEYFWDNRYYTNISSPAFSMGVRIPKRPIEASPGPGAYNVPKTKHGPAYTMHSGSERYGFG